MAYITTDKKNTKKGPVTYYRLYEKRRGKSVFLAYLGSEEQCATIAGALHVWAYNLYAVERGIQNQTGLIRSKEYLMRPKRPKEVKGRLGNDLYRRRCSKWVCLRRKRKEMVAKRKKLLKKVRLIFECADQEARDALHPDLLRVIRGQLTSNNKYPI